MPPPPPVPPSIHITPITADLKDSDGPPRQCIALNAAQKQLVFDEYQRRKRDKEPVDQQGLAAWASSRFNLPAPPSQSTISRILKNVGGAAAAAARHYTPGTGPPGVLLSPISKRHRLTGNPHLEQALHAWINAQFAARRSVNGALIVDAARRIQDKMNMSLPPDKRVSMKFSNGWLQKFKQRCNLGSFKSPGSVPSSDSIQTPPTSAATSTDPCHPPTQHTTVDIALVNTSLLAIKDSLRPLAMRDIWNAHEFGHCYKMSPNSTMVDHPPGNRSDKTRVTYLACANADGSERFPLLVVGHVTSPSSFATVSTQRTDFDYHHNRNALMTSSIFFDWLLRFDKYIESTSSERQVILLVESCEVHGTPETLPPLTHVKVCHLPPQREAKMVPLQPLVTAIKARYRLRQFEMALDNLDIARDMIFFIDLLTSVRIVSDIWTSLPTEFFERCWNDCQILPDAMVTSPTCDTSTTDDLLLKETLDELNKIMLDVVPRVTLNRLTVDDLIHPVEETDILQIMSEEELASAAAAALIGRDSVQDGDDDEEACCFVTASTAEQLKSLVVVKHLIQQENVEMTPILEEINRKQQDLRAQRERGTKPMKVSSKPRGKS